MPKNGALPCLYWQTPWSTHSFMVALTITGHPKPAIALYALALLSSALVESSSRIRSTANGGSQRRELCASSGLPSECPQDFRKANRSGWSEHWPPRLKPPFPIRILPVHRILPMNPSRLRCPVHPAVIDVGPAPTGSGDAYKRRGAPVPKWYRVLRIPGPRRFPRRRPNRGSHRPPAVRCATGKSAPLLAPA